MSKETTIDLKQVKAVILAGRRDFASCSPKSSLQTALWPVGKKTVLEHLLHHLSQEGIQQAIICSDDKNCRLEELITHKNGIKLDIIDEPLPLGTAGSIRKAAHNANSNSLFLVMHANMISPPKIEPLVREHYQGQSDLTVVLHSDTDKAHFESEAAGIYLCEQSVLKFIPPEGYCDIKEGLIPALLKAGKTVYSHRLSRSLGSFRDWPGYLRAMTVFLDNAQQEDIDLPAGKSSELDKAWISNTAQIDTTAQIVGPAIIMDEVKISEGAVIAGPVVLGARVKIGRNSLVADSVLWDDAKVGSDCEIQRCLFDYKVQVPNGTVLEGKSVPSIDRKITPNPDHPHTILKTKKVLPIHTNLTNENLCDDENISPRTKRTRQLIFALLGTGGILAAFTWSYWPVIRELWTIWMQSDEYSIGLMVPVLVIYIVWTRREIFRRSHIRPCMWGLLFLLVAQGFRYGGLCLYYNSAERFSLVLSIAALVLLLLGWNIFRKSSAILLFLFLMLPLPKSFEQRITLPLQSWSTTSAVFCLETLGYDVTQEGHIIHLGDTTVGVVEACNGLRMVTAFFVITGLVVLLVNREWWEKFILILSALPVGLLCNTLRLTCTSIAFTKLEGKRWETLFHDFGGFAMMPLALAIVVFELWLIDKLTTAPSTNNKQEDILITHTEG